MFKKSPKLNKPLILFFLTTFLFFSELASAQSCSGCIQIDNSKDIIVKENEVVCIPSGVNFNRNLTLRKGGTVCVSPGATFNPNISELNGTIINHGQMSFNYYNEAHGKIINHNQFNTTGFQNFAGTLENFGIINFNSYYSFTSAATISNSETINFNSGGAFNGNFNNFGNVIFASGAQIRGIVNNYKSIKFNNSVDIYADTYINNDGTLEFLAMYSAVNLLGPMITNNGTLKVEGSLHLNGSVSQLNNNGTVEISGEISHNNSDTRIINNCTILAGKYTVHGGISINNGLIILNQNQGNFSVNGSTAQFINGKNGFVSGKDFTNSGKISGFGKFHFTGYTQTENVFRGDSATEPIEFFDTTLSTGSVILDNVAANNPYNKPVNTIRPTSMTMVTSDNYDCGQNPETISGYPPTSNILSYNGARIPEIIFQLDGKVAPHKDVQGKKFRLDYNKIVLIDEENQIIVGNSSEMIIPGKGKLNINQNAHTVSFIPEDSFVNGSLKIFYQISNSWNGFPSTFVGKSTPIEINFQAPCYKDPNTEPTPADSFTNSGVTSLSRPSTSWPGNIPNGFLALESKDKGFVITRVLNQDAITDPKEGMLIYDIQAGCVKLHNGTDWNCIQKKCN